MEYLWIVFAVAMLQPVLGRKLLEAARRRQIAKIEADRGSRVIALVHRQETMSLLGFPLMRYIDIDDSEAVLRAIQLTDDDVPLDLILHTPGGLALASFQIARALHRHPAKVTVFVPHYAMSGGTLIALAADEIVMSPHAMLGPVDPQVGGMSAASLVRAVDKKSVDEIDDATLVLEDQARMALRQVRDGVCELFLDDRPQDEALALATKLSDGSWTHDHGITVEQARELKLPVSDAIPGDVIQLMSMFPQPVRSGRSVEYLPGTRERAHG